MQKKKAQMILLISGVAGAGKKAVAEVLRQYPKTFGFSVSYTTRSPRPGEVEGVDYHFISEAEFDQAIRNKEFLEYENVHGDKYGTKEADLQKLIDTSIVPVVEIDVKGYSNLKKKYRNIVSIFVTPPSLEEAMERLSGRATETSDDQAIRVSRYEMEIGHRNLYDYQIINGDLEVARRQLKQIAQSELNKRRKHFDFLEAGKNFGLLFSMLLLFGGGFAAASFGLKAKITQHIQSNAAVETAGVLPSPDSIGSAAASWVIPTLPEPEMPKEVADEPKPTAAKVAPEIKKKIAAAPPKQNSSASTPIVESTKTNSDGSTTTVISTGGEASNTDIEKTLEVPAAVISSPSDIAFFDETGRHADMDLVLKEYLSGLPWKDEISSLKSITLRDAGFTGWSGQYLGSYTLSPDNKNITSASGMIILNTTYYENSELFTDYMKLVLSHEYAHHYTLWHKWTKWNLPIGTRFPDSYYTTRPLSKITTATDYSKGWGNCEAEVIAEDYSYLYSGYGYHGMARTYGYPKEAMRNWFAKIGTPELLQTKENAAPVISLLEPQDGSTLSGKTILTAQASDDLGIEKISFYINGTLVGEDKSAPYSLEIPTETYENGSYTIKAEAFDGELKAEASAVVIFQNNEIDLTKPTIMIDEPTQNPVTIQTSKLKIDLTASDNIGVDRIEFYYNDTLQGSWQKSHLVLELTFNTASTFALTFRAYDVAGNYSDVDLVVVREEAVAPGDS